MTKYRYLVSYNYQAPGTMASAFGMSVLEYTAPMQEFEDITNLLQKLAEPLPANSTVVIIAFTLMKVIEE